MAASPLVYPPAKATSRFLLRKCKPNALSPFVNHLRPSPCTAFTDRFTCSSSVQQDRIDMSKYRDAFARRMAMAGLKPHHRIALGVSGGPDSIALCVLAAAWKTNSQDIFMKRGTSEFIDGLLAIVVNHGLRTESKDEADLVCNRVASMGIRCEIACCEWLDGKPGQGHLQEAARDKRYEILQSICVQHQIGVLLIAHHADDQAELFILRLSWNSGVLGLAGMAFVSPLFPKSRHFSMEALSESRILLVRPLMEFSKDDMYKICLGGNQEWVEDPTNQSPLFTRNRIRMSLSHPSSDISKSELQTVISACRSTRIYVDKICSNLIEQAVKIIPEGYAVIDLTLLNPSAIKDIILSKFLTLVVQFISQKHRPVRGSATKLLLNYIRTSPCKTCLTVAGCYLCPAPGSRGTKVLVCCSVNSYFPPTLELLRANSNETNDMLDQIVQIIADGRSMSENFSMNASDLQFLDDGSSEAILREAKMQGMLSESTYRGIINLQKQESEKFKPQNIVVDECESKGEVNSSNPPHYQVLNAGQVGYFTNRFLVHWNLREKMSCNSSFLNNLQVEKQHLCSSCIIGDSMKAEVRRMIDDDWLYLAELSKCQNERDNRQIFSGSNMEQLTKDRNLCSDYVEMSAQRALFSLKSIPVAARRSLPVLVNPEGQLLSIPAVCFEHCPCLTVSAVFKPRVPLGGGHSSFV